VSYDGEELFDHQVSAWTAGHLRIALVGVPDDLLVRIITAEKPGSDLAGDEQVMISAAPWADVDVGPTGSAADVRAKLPGGELQPDHFEISAEFPSGQYYRRTGR
jgi:Family of unknown function (DUF6225)